MANPENPKVSVIVPTHNRADLLPRAVDSVLAQTYGNYELVIVDDCSSDDTPGRDSRLLRPAHTVVHDTTETEGKSAAVNTGIAHALGEYIGFLDDDDEWLPKKLEGQVALLDASSPYSRAGVRLDGPGRRFQRPCDSQPTAILSRETYSSAPCR